MSSIPEHPTRGNILLVDDTPNNLRLLSAMLAEQGYEVRRVINGQMALKTAQANPPDLILLDIKMPDMNGYEVCQHLKAIEQTQSIPVIFISALDEVLDKVKAFAVGGVDYITKPFSEEEVFARVENILTIRNLQQQLQVQNQRLHQESIKRQQLEEELARSKVKYHQLFENPAVGLFRIRRDGFLLEVNQHLAELLGYESAAAIVGQAHFSDYMVNADSLEQLTKSIAQPLKGSTLPLGHYPHKIQFYKQDRTTFWGLASVWLSTEDCWEGAVLAVPQP